MQKRKINNYIISLDGKIAFITLTRGFRTIIDIEDLERVLEFSWHSNPTRSKTHFNCYAKTQRIILENGKPITKLILLHRFVMNAPPESSVDHINRDGLDNRKCNLRFATTSQNQANRDFSAQSTTGFRGVHFHKLSQKFQAKISVNNKNIYLGLHPTAQDAARIYNEAARKYQGEFAQLNEI